MAISTFSVVTIPPTDLSPKAVDYVAHRVVSGCLVMCTAAMISLLVQQTVEEEVKNKHNTTLAVSINISFFVCTSMSRTFIHSFTKRSNRIRQTG